jgi:hypothetical protein
MSAKETGLRGLISFAVMSIPEGISIQSTASGWNISLPLRMILATGYRAPSHSGVSFEGGMR